MTMHLYRSDDVEALSIGHIGMTIAAARGPHGRSVAGTNAACAVGTAASSRTHLLRVPASDDNDTEPNGPVTRMHKPRWIALNGNIETSASRKVDKENTKAV